MLWFVVTAKADYITDILTITNTPTNGYSVTINSAIWTWTNTITTNANQIANTNTIVAARSNLFNAIALNIGRIPGVSLYTNDTNGIKMLGSGLSVSISTNWATNVFSTNASTNASYLALPVEVIPIAQRTNLASLTVTAIGNYSTSAIPQISAAAGELVGLTNTQTVSGPKTFTNKSTIISGGSVSNINILGTNSISTNLTISTSNIVLFQFGADPDGNFGGVPLRLQWNSTNQELELNTGTLGNPVVPLHARFVGDGGGLSTLDAGTITVGSLSVSRLNNGTDASDTAFWRGDGVWSGLVGTGTNLTLTGTNTVNSILDFSPFANTSLANGANAAVSVGTNVYVKVSGPSSAFTLNGIANGISGRMIVIQNSTGQSMTIANDSGVEPVSANRIYTGAGGDLTLTNNPLFVTFIYDSALGHWNVASFNAVSTNTVVTTGTNAVNVLTNDTRGFTNSGTVATTGTVNGNIETQNTVTVTNGIIDNGPTTNRMAVFINHTLSNAPSITDGQIFVADAATAGGFKATNFPASGGGSSSNITASTGIVVTPGGGNATVAIDTTVVPQLGVTNLFTAASNTFSKVVYATNFVSRLLSPSGGNVGFGWATSGFRNNGGTAIYMDVSGTQYYTFDSANLRLDQNTMQIIWAANLGIGRESDGVLKVSDSGSGWGSIHAQGFNTYNTNQFTVAASGWTNTNAFNCVMYITGATAATFTVSDGTNTIFTDTGLTFTTAETIVMHPSYKVTVASGTITGVAVAQ